MTDCICTTDSSPYMVWVGEKCTKIDWKKYAPHCLEYHSDTLSDHMRRFCEKIVANGGAPHGNGKYKGPWAFSLTMSPKDGLSEEEMVSAARKIMSQTSCPVKKYSWYLEYKEDGRHPHIHGMYETDAGGRIECKYWKRAWPIWNEAQKLGSGFRGGYHRPVRNGEQYSEYIAKDGGLSESKGVE